jgi:hypothetical protein
VSSVKNCFGEITANVTFDNHISGPKQEPCGTLGVLELNYENGFYVNFLYVYIASICYSLPFLGKIILNKK